MKNILFGLSIFSLFLSCSFVNAQSSSEKSAILNALIDNDRFMKDQLIPLQKASHFIPEQLESFDGLTYFEVDEKWRFFAQLQRDENQEEIAMTTTDGQSISLLRYGSVTINFSGTMYTLSVFRDQNLPELSEQPGCLFIPFSDETSGNETYEGGRYLIVKIPMHGENIQLDFNLAFNPYSAYHLKNKSVLAPDENRLPFKITAGEKNYQNNQGKSKNLNLRQEIRVKNRKTRKI